MTVFPPNVLREYALLADGERGIVVGPHGDIAWMCMPSWDGDAVFSSLLGGPGSYSVTPHGTSYVWGGHYEEGSLIWRSRWVTTESIVECREALALPADEQRALVLRRVEARHGPARVRVLLDPRAGFGAQPMTDLALSSDVWTAHCGTVALRWSGAGHAVEHDGALVADLTLEAGESHDLVLEMTTGRLGAHPAEPNASWAETEQAWRAAVPALEPNLAPRDSRHAYAVLRGMTRRGGGMVAAATTSLPERAEEGRNYDYRYSWIRDQCFAGHAVAAHGAHDLLDDALTFVAARLLEHGPHLEPAYTTTGKPIPDERTLDLPGYPGGGVRVGNRVTGQFQLDAYGEALLLLAAGARRDRLDSDHWRAVEVAVDAIARRRDDKGAGIWELGADRWTHSRLICAAGLRAVAREAPKRQRARWASMADALVTSADRECLHQTGRWQRSPGDGRVDAALLLPALRGALPADDPRSRQTLGAVLRELGSEHYLYRFRHDQRPLPDAEGAFLLCGFQMALALHQQGERVEAVRWFERNRAACGPPGLFTEEFDVVQRQLRGNLPQAFVHALLLESARRLTEPDDTEVTA